MARWMVRPQSVITMIAMVPPPIPSSEEKVPRPPAIPTRTIPDGMVSLTTFPLTLGSRKLSDIRTTPPPKIILSVRPSTWLASKTPAPHPMTIHGAQALSTSNSTAPRLAWDRSDRIDVTMMVAADVPIATWAMASFVPPSSGKTTSKAGTTTKPPPIPKMPAANPASNPAASMATSGTSHVVTSADITAPLSAQVRPRACLCHRPAGSRRRKWGNRP